MFLLPAGEGSDFSALSPDHICFICLWVASLLAWFFLQFNKNISVPDRSPIGGQLYGKPPTVTSVLGIHWTTTSLAIFIVGHSKTCLVLGLLVPLSRASCLWNRTLWCRVLVFLLPLLPLLPRHYTGASATVTASIAVSISTASQRDFKYVSSSHVCVNTFFSFQFFLYVEILTWILGS